MGDPSKTLASLLINSRVAQYPDAKLYNAASLLNEEERPSAPVRLVDPDPQKHPIFRVNPRVAGWASRRPDDPHIAINRESSDYKSSGGKWLAGILAHEAKHLKQDPTRMPESEAYAQQLSVLKRLGYDNDNALRVLQDRQQTHSKQEQSNLLASKIK